MGDEDDGKVETREVGADSGAMERDPVASRIMREVGSVVGARIETIRFVNYCSECSSAGANAEIRPA